MRTRMLTALSLALIVAAGVVEGHAEPLAAPALDRDAVRRIVREYLIERPEVLEEAMRVLRERRELQQRARSRAAIAEHGEALRAHPMSPVSGNPNGDVTVVEFFDYRCGYCKRSLRPVMELLAADGQVRMVWKEFPILGPDSRFAARAAMAAHRQGRYHEFHLALMGAQGKLTEESVLAIAADVGLDVERLSADSKDPAIERYLDETALLAQAIGVRGTPAFVIGGRLVRGAVTTDRLKEIVAEARGG